MTPEQMEVVRDKIIAALKDADGFEGVESVEYDPGEPLPIMFEFGEDVFSLELMIA